jgi:hypothetical protein
VRGGRRDAGWGVGDRIGGDQGHMALCEVIVLTGIVKVVMVDRK